MYGSDELTHDVILFFILQIPRNISKIRTQKRRALEKADAVELAVLAEDDNGSDSDDDNSSVEEEAARKRKRKKKLRGSMAALEDDVLEGSMIFHPAATRDKKGDDSDGDVGDGDGAEDFDDDDEVDGAKGSVAKKTQKSSRAAKKAAPRKKKTAASANAGKQTKKRRQMYRLRNFQSFKMAQRHGDALAAHAQGNYELAIHKLKAVSKDAPSAPQVYASLGMVYEDMLKECKARYLESRASDDGAPTILLPEPEEQSEEVNAETGAQSPKIAPFIPIPLLQEQCDLAKKAYGSHHISAVLCKKDFSLWVRSGNCAMDIA